MELTIKITMDNDAFVPDWQPEAARILKEVASDLENGITLKTLRDLYGNRAGRITLSF